MRICQERLQSGAEKANSALYANLAKGLFARFYAKLLIPRLLDIIICFQAWRTLRPSSNPHPTCPKAVFPLT